MINEKHVPQLKLRGRCCGSIIVACDPKLKPFALDQVAYHRPDQLAKGVGIAENHLHFFICKRIILCL